MWIGGQAESIRRPNKKRAAGAKDAVPFAEGNGRVVQMFEKAVHNHDVERIIGPGQVFCFSGEKRYLKTMVGEATTRDYEPSRGDVDSHDRTARTSRGDEKATRTATDFQDQSVLRQEIRERLAPGFGRVDMAEETGATVISNVLCQFVISGSHPSKVRAWLGSDRLEALGLASFRGK